MSTLRISYLVGNPSPDEAEILDALLDDAGLRPAALPDDPNLEREMAEAYLHPEITAWAA